MYDRLKRSVAQTSLIVDQLIHKEMQLIVGDDDMYFIFKDYIYKVGFKREVETSYIPRFCCRFYGTQMYQN